MTNLTLTGTVAPDAQDRPCPPWCACQDGHLEDSDGNRYHLSTPATVTLTLEDPEAGTSEAGQRIMVPSALEAVLLQEDRHGAPVVAMDHNDQAQACLTLDEAEQLAEGLGVLGRALAGCATA